MSYSSFQRFYKIILAIGYSCILTMTTKTVLTKQRGTTQALYILTVNNNSRFEFIFTKLNNRAGNTEIFKSIYDIYRQYQATYLYRELKLRGAILSHGHLNVLPQEEVYNTINGVWNLSSDQGNLGTLMITNIRVIWYADINEIFNISLPFLQILNIRVRESKYGPALVLTTLNTAGGYVLGFRIDPQEKLGDIYKELISLHAVYSENPIFGVSYSYEDNKNLIKTELMIRADDVQEIDDSKESEVNAKFTTYLADDSSDQKREPVYCKELGFAMEKIKDGYTLKDLWNVVET